MERHKLDGYLFAQMIQVGANFLANNVAKVDALNVFPVPDGDTGTNMNLSFSSGVQEMNKQPSRNISSVSKALSRGLLMGARGNSGVILSQLFRGFGQAIENNSELNAQQFAKALQSGVDTAYKAVMKPVEGTILTVAKDAARVAKRKANVSDDLTEVMQAVLTEAKASLQRTPDLLPILKQVGVVDSGGQGLVYVYEGFLSVLQGNIVAQHHVETESTQTTIENKEEHVLNEVAEMMAAGVLSVDDIQFGYCTEFIIRLDNDKQAGFEESNFRQQISQFGDSLLVIADEELVKVHIHAEELDQVMMLAQSFGQLINIKIENMREQFLAVQQNLHTHNRDNVRTTSSQEIKPYGIITVAMGEGLTNIFKSIGADIVIAGGQTMNPSTQDFIQASEQIEAEQIIILPNNSNIVMAANQAIHLIKRPTLVVPTTNIPQGLAALLNFKATASLETNNEQMLEASKQVTAGQVTYAIRDSKLDEIEIKEGQFMGFMNGRIEITDEDLGQCTQQLIARMMTPASEIITLIYGQDVQRAQAMELVEQLEQSYPDIDIEVHNGGQPVYAYYISIE